MSIITVQHNLSNNQWTGAASGLTSSYCHLQIGVISNQAHTIFDELSFGFELKHDSTTVQSENFPTPPIVYHSSYEPYLAYIPLNLSPQTDYTLHVWVENSKNHTTFEYKFITPPITDTGDYVNSSVQHPDPDNVDEYKFDNAIRQWVRK